MMKNMTPEQIARVCSGIYHGSEAIKGQCVEGISIDSRQIEKNWLFVATKGERVDGHSFVGQVIEKGALCVVVEKKPETECPYILVKDSFQAIKDMAAFYRSQLSCKVVGITGSVGKTSTKEMIAGTLSAKFQVLKTAGNFNNEVGLPLTVFRIREEHQVAVLEMGISDFGEMSRLTAIARPDICVITNIGECHLENLGTRDGVLKAKTEIFEGLSEDGFVVLNGNDDKLCTVKQVSGKQPYFFGNGQCYAENIVSRGLFGTECDIHIGDKTVHAKIKVPGVHQTGNAMAAVCVADILGLTPDEMEKGIASVEAIGGRSHIMKGETYVIIDDCYNANPVSMKASLDLLSEAEGRKVAILGDMFELGSNSDALHESVGSYAKTTGADVLICIGQNARHIYNGAQGGPLKCYHYETKEDFIKEKDVLLEKDDTLLIKASHGMAFETIIKELAD